MQPIRITTPLVVAEECGSNTAVITIHTNVYDGYFKKSYGITYARRDEYGDSSGRHRLLRICRRLVSMWILVTSVI